MRASLTPCTSEERVDGQTVEWRRSRRWTRLARVLRASRQHRRPHPRKRLPERDARPRRGLPPPREPVGVLLTFAVGHTDPRHPLMFRHNDLVYRWGGPNVDQNARRAVISGEGTYRVSGNMGACDE